MKTNFTLLMLSCCLVSCNDPMELGKSVNQRIDSEIADRISRLNKNIGDHSAVTQKNSHALQKVDMEVRELINSINLFDASSSVMTKADDYFAKCSEQMLRDTGMFIRITTLTTKPEIVSAIKLNELILLDRLLFEVGLKSN